MTTHITVIQRRHLFWLNMSKDVWHFTLPPPSSDSKVVLVAPNLGANSTGLRHENHILVQIPCFTLGSTSFCCPVKKRLVHFGEKPCCHIGGHWTTCYLDLRIPKQKLLARSMYLYMIHIYVDDGGIPNISMISIPINM